MKLGAAGTGLSILILSVGCAPTAPPRTAEGVSAPESASRPKILTIAQLNSVRLYGPWEFSNTQGGGAVLAEIHTSGLIVGGPTGGPEPRLAERLPSLSDGSVVMEPDGRMRTTWKLRPNITWHDGAPFTADDLVFSARLHSTPELASSIDAAIARAERTEAPDPTTFVVTWKQPFYRALDLGSRDLWPFPKHLLGDWLEGDKAAFLNQPYFTSDYVNLGPFRLVSWGLGEEQVFERFDGYFLGRPRFDRVILKTVPDPNVVLAHFRAGAIDIAPEQTLPLDAAAELRDELQKSGAGAIRVRQYNWWYIWFQFEPSFADPPELSRDPRVRRGLLHAMDRDAVREVLMPGFPNTGADTFMPKNDPRGSLVGQPFARYPYDPSRAAQDLADAGWQRGPDGKVASASGAAVQIELRSSPAYKQVGAMVSDFWRRTGLDVSENYPPTELGRDNEYKSKFPGAETRARGIADGVLVSFDGRLHSGPQNRWLGANTSHYANAALDSLIDRLYVSIDQREQGVTLRDIGEILATDLPAIPMYYIIAFTVIGKDIDALANDYDYAGTQALLSRNAHLWDRR